MKNLLLSFSACLLLSVGVMAADSVPAPLYNQLSEQTQNSGEVQPKKQVKTQENYQDKSQNQYQKQYKDNAPSGEQNQNQHRYQNQSGAATMQEGSITSSPGKKEKSFGSNQSDNTRGSGNGSGRR
ncbi:hypothetical protein KKG72_09445 [bacterium]|nr:hypothetical protein [bacterium]MBU1993108.1 hypothetical protein [bacterium]